MAHDIQAKSPTSLKAKEKAALHLLRDKSFPIQFRKEFNSFGKIFFIGLYSIICFAIGGLYALKNNPKHMSNELKNMEENIIASLRSKESSNNSRMDILGNNHALSLILEKNLKKVILEKDNHSTETINSQKRKIHNLESKINNLLESEDRYKNLSRYNAKNPSLTIPYNSKNLNSLSFEQGIKLRRFRTQLKEEKEAFLAIHHLENPADREKWRNLEDSHKIAIHKLRQKFSEEKYDFRRKKFRIQK
jgi:hypothetical protein